MPILQNVKCDSGSEEGMGSDVPHEEAKNSKSLNVVPIDGIDSEILG
jgi:hypothetical protein